MTVCCRICLVMTCAGARLADHIHWRMRLLGAVSQSCQQTSKVKSSSFLCLLLFSVGGHLRFARLMSVSAMTWRGLFWKFFFVILDFYFDFNTIVTLILSSIPASIGLVVGLNLRNG